VDALEAIAGRRSIGRLVAPAPDRAELDVLLHAAVAAPDHGELRPWRFVAFRGEGRRRLGEVYALAHVAREPDADAGALEKTAAKPLRAPLVVAVICTPVPPEAAWNGKAIPPWEQLAAVAAAVQNLCVAAHARGWGSMWRTGWYGEAPEVRRALGLGDEDTVVGWVYLGTIPPTATTPSRRPTDLAQVVEEWV
jgi:nitroreductase